MILLNMMSALVEPMHSSAQSGEHWHWRTKPREQCQRWAQECAARQVAIGRIVSIKLLGYANVKLGRVKYAHQAALGTGTGGASLQQRREWVETA